MNAAQIRQGQSTLPRSSLRGVRSATGATILSRCFENQSASVDGAQSTAHSRRRTIDGARSTRAFVLGRLARSREPCAAGLAAFVGASPLGERGRRAVSTRGPASVPARSAVETTPSVNCGPRSWGTWRGFGRRDRTTPRQFLQCGLHFGSPCSQTSVGGCATVARRSNAWLAERQHPLDGHQCAAP